MGLTTGLALLVTTGCGLLDTSFAGGGGLVRSGGGGALYLVVTITGSPVARSTLTVADTIPDSTPLPRPVLPTPDPATTPRSAASPSSARSVPPPALRARATVLYRKDRPSPPHLDSGLRSAPDELQTGR